MRRTERVQGLGLMKFEEIYGRTRRGALAQSEAAEILGVSERTFRRWRDRYEAEGAEGLYDRRGGPRRGGCRRTVVRNPRLALWKAAAKHRLPPARKPPRESRSGME